MRGVNDRRLKWLRRLHHAEALAFDPTRDALGVTMGALFSTLQDLTPLRLYIDITSIRFDFG